MRGEHKTGTDFKIFKSICVKFHKDFLICSRGFDRLLACDKHSDLGHVQMCRSVTNQPHLHGEKEVPGLGQGAAQGDQSAVGLLLLHGEVSLLVTGHYAQQHHVSRDGIGGSHPEDVGWDGSAGGEADVVEGDSQWKGETRRRVPRELASYALATAEKGKHGKGSLDAGRDWLYTWEARDAKKREGTEERRRRRQEFCCRRTPTVGARNPTV